MWWAILLHILLRTLPMRKIHIQRTTLLGCLIFWLIIFLFNVERSFSNKEPNFAPLLAGLFLYSYEAESIQTLIKSGKRHLAKSFCFTYRYIDDVLSINNPKFGDFINFMYPVELEIRHQWCWPPCIIFGSAFEMWQFAPSSQILSQIIQEGWFEFWLNSIFSNKFYLHDYVHWTKNTYKIKYQLIKWKF